jgi:hypothetical protein
MDPAKPDQDASAVTDSSRLAAAVAGKTERSDEKQQPHEPSKRHNHKPPEDDESVERLAGDVLLGAKSIAEYITSLGFPVTETDIYYLHRMKKWPFSKYGAFLVASKRRLTSHAEQLLHGSTAA